jgi:hypothetical protein
MSGSYQQLLQKYNQLLALVLSGGGSGGTLQSVINTNDELQGSPPALNEVIKYDGTNVVWAPSGGGSTNIVRSGSASIPAGDTSGTIPFGITFPNIPEVVISQVGGIGNIVGLAVTGVTTTGFNWESTAPNVGGIIFIANYN